MKNKDLILISLFNLLENMKDKILKKFLSLNNNYNYWKFSNNKHFLDIMKIRSIAIIKYLKFSKMLSQAKFKFCLFYHTKKIH